MALPNHATIYCVRPFHTCGVIALGMPVTTATVAKSVRTIPTVPCHPPSSRKQGPFLPDAAGAGTSYRDALRPMSRVQAPWKARAAPRVRPRVRPNPRMQPTGWGGPALRSARGSWWPSSGSVDSCRR